MPQLNTRVIVFFGMSEAACAELLRTRRTNSMNVLQNWSEVYRDEVDVPEDDTHEHALLLHNLWREFSNPDVHLMITKYARALSERSGAQLCEGDLVFVDEHYYLLVDAKRGQFARISLEHPTPCSGCRGDVVP